MAFGSFRTRDVAKYLLEGCIVGGIAGAVLLLAIGAVIFR